MRDGIVITGMGVVTPVGIGVDTYWENLTAGVCGIGEITQIDTTALPIHRAAEVHGFHPKDFMPTRLALDIEPYQQYAYAAAEQALKAGTRVDEAIRAHVVRANNSRYSKVNEIAKYLVAMFPQHAAVMTQCFGETIVGMMLKEAKLAGKQLRLFCPETRPYFQGARLTATVCHDMGFDVTVITDNMPAFVMEREGIDVFTCAADAICLDGYVVNKVGTFQIAICANHFGIPTFVTGAPDAGHPTKDTVTIEMRDPAFTLQAMGVRTVAEGVKGYYPAFDLTPPHLISGIVTDRGVFSPFDLQRYFSSGGMGEYEMVV